MRSTRSGGLAAQEGCTNGRRRGRGEAEGRRRRRAAVREHADDGGVLPPPTGVVINCCKCVVGINGFPTAYHPALAQKEIVVVEIEETELALPSGDFSSMAHGAVSTDNVAEPRPQAV